MQQERRESAYYLLAWRLHDAGIEPRDGQGFRHILIFLSVLELDGIFMKMLRDAADEGATGDEMEAWYDKEFPTQDHFKSQFG